jgi:predicted O-methyltransferase YrrM
VPAGSTAPPEPGEPGDQRWVELDGYLERTLVGEDLSLERALAANAAAGLPPEDVSATQGRLLTVLALATGATRALEIGTLGGISSICIARGLGPAGCLISIEVEPARAEVARRNIAMAGFEGAIEVRAGVALELLPDLAGEPPFDLIFIDADKARHDEYLEWALRLSRPGTLIVADNVIRDGAVGDPRSDDPRVQGVRRMLERIGSEPRLTATAIQTVGPKGWDGLAFVVVGENEPAEP